MLTAYIFHLKVLHKPDYIKRKKVSLFDDSDYICSGY